MIKYVTRKQLNVQQYDACIENSLQTRVSALSWYLDIVAENWDVLVLEDYHAVMPIPWKKKFGIKYVYPPFWLLELGVFSLDATPDIQPFLEILYTNFKSVESKLNTDNFNQKISSFLIDKEMQTLEIDKDYEGIYTNYRKDRRKDLNKAKKAKLALRCNDNPQKLIDLFKNNVGKRTPFLGKKEYLVLHQLMEVCIEKGFGEILSVYTTENRLVASGFFLRYKKCATILVSSTDFENRNHGENTFLIDRAISKYHQQFTKFNFGGSSIKSIANYFLSFGASTEKYQQIQYNSLPKVFKILKSTTNVLKKR